jgi:Tol biopolymer transport system component
MNDPLDPDARRRSSWALITAILGELIELPVSERDGRLVALCGADVALQAEVQSLLESHEAAGNFVNGPVSFIADWVNGISCTSPSTRLGPYRLLQVIGEGGMGTVYRARRDDLEFQREVAIKIVSHGMVTSSMLRRFRAERQILANLTHPNITMLLDGGTTALGLPYLVMEFVAGEPITVHCDQRHLDLRERLALFHQVCLALEHAHRNGVIHRDLKPSNILVTPEGVPKVLDFGIACLCGSDRGQESAPTTKTVSFLTPHYAAPEQFTDVPPSPRTDVYALGVILWELVTGQRPSQGLIASHHDTSATGYEPPRSAPRSTARLHRKPWAHQIDGGLEAVMRKAVCLDAAARYDSAGDIADEIGTWLAGGSVRAFGGAYYRARRAVARRKYSLIAGGFMLATGLAGWGVASRAPAGQVPIVTSVTNLPGQEVNPRMSPDGKRVAFAWNGPDGQFDIYTQTIAGGNPVRITSDPHDELSPAWSRDATRLAFLRRHDAKSLATLIILTLSNMHEVDLTDIAIPYQEEIDVSFGGYLDWHPSLPWLAVSSSDGVNSGIWLVHSTTGEKRRVTDHADTAPAFSPDGHGLLFVRKTGAYEGQIWRLTLNDDLSPAAAPEQLTSGEGHDASPAWYPDGRAFAYTHSGFQSPNQAWTMGLSRSRHPQPVAGLTIPLAHLSAAGYSLIGLTRWIGVRYESDYDIRMLHDPDDGTQLLAPPLINSSKGEASAQFSPDGLHVAFQSDRSGAAEIWSARPDGSDLRRLTSFRGAFIGLPEWIDNEHVVTHARVRGVVQIFEIGLEGSDVRQLTHGTRSFIHPGASRDGRWVYAGGSDGHIWRIARSGSREPDKVGDIVGQSPRPSFDGHFLCYVRRDGGALSLWRVALPTGTPEKLVHALADQVAFTTVEEGIYVVTEGSPRLVQFYDYGTKRLRVIAPIARYGWGIGAFPQGAGLPRTLLVAADNTRADLVLVENFR